MIQSQQWLCGLVMVLTLASPDSFCLLSKLVMQNDQVSKTEFLESGKKLCELKVGMNEEQIMSVLGLGKKYHSRTIQSKAMGGIGFGGIRTEYFGHLENHIFVITVSLENERKLEWKSPNSALITISLGKPRKAKKSIELIE